jgi:C4-dicarboxylate-specific signal transduction histidine kinase
MARLWGLLAEKLKNLSVRSHLIMGVTLVHGILMAGFIFERVQQEKELLANQVKENAYSLASTLGVTVAPWAHSRDLAGLAEVINSFLTFKNLNYAFIQTDDGKVLAHTDPKWVGLFATDKQSQFVFSAEHLFPKLVHESDVDVEYASPIVVGSKHIGWARVSLDKSSTNSKIQVVFLKGLAFTLLAILVGGLMAWLVSSLLVYQLNNLVRVAEEIKNGNLSTQCDDSSQNEIGKLAQAFNQMMKSINENKQHLVQSAKMVSLGEMASGIAHEINNPLFIIRGRSQLVLKQVETMPKEQISQEVGKIAEMSDRIARIVKGLKAFSREASTDPLLPTSISEVLHDSINLVSEKIKMSGVDLRIENIGSSQVRCRSSEISQVFVNLISNSLDAIEHQEEKWIHIAAAESEGLLTISFADSGKGIDLMIRDKIMQPFFTTKPVGAGTGLGLSISKGIIEGHGGRFYLDTETNHTCFKIELPLDEDWRSV